LKKLYLFLLLLVANAPCRVNGQAVSANDLLRSSGVTGGLVVVIGCPDPGMLVSYHASDAFLVHGLDTDSQGVERARAVIQDRGLYGRVSIAEYRDGALPYSDNLINLVVVYDTIPGPASEVLRVLAPRGVAVVRKKGNEDWLGEVPYARSRLNDDFVMFTKPVPSAIDDWTHFLHGPDNNALAEDRVVGPPRHMQWRAGPMWGRHHDAEKGTYPTLRNLLSARGRLICLVDQTESSDMTVPSQWALVARDAFSGVRLWERDIQVKALNDVKHKWGLEEVWRQVILDEAHVYAALASDAALSALDIDTGRVIRTYAGTNGFSEVIKSEDTLLLVMPDHHIVAVQAETGQRLWQWEAGKEGEIIRITLAAANGRIFVKTERRVVCLSAAEGIPLWRRALPQSEKKIKLYFPREKLIVRDGVVLVSYAGKDPVSLNRDAQEFMGMHPRVREYGGKLAALSAADGRSLWQAPYYPNLEGAPGEIYVSEGTVWLGPDFAQPRDLHSGRIKQHRPVIRRLWTDGHHYRCYPGKATSQYVLTAKRGIEFIDLDGENHSRNNWTRGTCRVGVLPCNGLVYTPPHSCGCYSEAQLIGFWALAGRRSVKGEERRVKEETNRLIKGPAYQTFHPSPLTLHTSKDWPTLRHDIERSGSTEVAIPPNLKPAWRTPLGGRLSALTVAQGRVFVAQIDAHTVHALDAASGRRLWQHTVGGRVDSPPTVFQGLVLFGAADGFVYCLRATDGALVWRFLAAPQHRYAVAFDQVESVWPVHGSVLIQQGVAYVAAGRSSHLDGGIWLYGLDPVTGRVVAEHHIKSDPPVIADPPDDSETYAKRIKQNSLDYKTFLAADRSDAFSMQGALNDVLVGDQDSIYLRHLRLNRELIPQQERRMHLYSVSTLLDDYGHNRADWLLGSGNQSRLSVAFPWYPKRGHMSVAYGTTLAFDTQTVWSVRGSHPGLSRPVSYTLNAESRLPAVDRDFPDTWPGPKKTKSGKDSDTGSWSIPLSCVPRALIRAGDSVVVSGREIGKGILQVVGSRAGKILSTHPLSASPVWDGMAIAGGCLYVVLEDGEVLCMQGVRSTE
jgi:outer membrane protein assembly factor BamB